MSLPIQRRGYGYSFFAKHTNQVADVSLQRHRIRHLIAVRPPFVRSNKTWMMDHTGCGIQKQHSLCYTRTLSPSDDDQGGNDMDNAECHSQAKTHLLSVFIHLWT